MDPTNFPFPATHHMQNMEVNMSQAHVPAPHHPIDHPPYAEMIAAAITSLKEPNGSSRQAIAKYIERVYKELPPTHSILLTQHLRRLKNDGHLVMLKHCYKLPGFDFAPSPAAVGADSGRKRGRPPKTKPGDHPINVPISDVPVNVPVSEAPANVLVSEVPINVPVANVDAPAGVVKRRPGRPAKVKAGVVGPNGIKRNPVRARKTKLVSGVMIPFVHGTRGRPKKIVSSDPNVVPNGGGIATAKVGRPRKAGRKKVIGKSAADKPWKNDGASSGPPLWMVDYGYVKFKFDNVQSRIAHAVSQLKPYLTDETATSVVSALQELEEISKMNVIGAPYHAVQVDVESQV